MATDDRTWKDGLGLLRTERRETGSVRIRQLTLPEEVVREVEEDLAAAASLGHPAMVRVLSVTRLPDGLEVTTEAGVGVPLRKFLSALSEKDEKLAVSNASWVALELFKLLTAAQARMDAGKLAPVIHGRLSPGNILLTPAGEVRVTGFGLDAAARHLIQLGTPLDRTYGYIAPEQRDSARPRPESDVFAVASILAEMIHGQPLFVGRTLAETLGAVGIRAPPSLRAKRPEVPLALEEAVAWCLEKVPEKRPRAEAAVARFSAFQGMLDAGDRLRLADHPGKLADLLRLRLGAAEVVDWPTETMEATEDVLGLTLEMPRATAPPKRTVLRVALAALVALGAGALVLAARWQTLGPEVLSRLPERWRERYGAWLSTAAADAGAASATVPTLDAGPSLDLVASAQATADAGGPDAGEREGPRLAHLVVKGSGSGRVRLDGNDVGAMPPAELDVAAGEHRLDLVGPHARVRATERVTVQPGEHKTVVLRGHRK